MPRAFLVVKKKQEGGLVDSSVSMEQQKRPRFDMDPASVAYHHYMAPVSGDEQRASPSPSAYSSDGPYSPATSELREGRVSPPTDPTPFSCTTTGVPYSQIGGVFDLSHKRRRLDSHDDLHAQISPRSFHSESGSESSTSPGPHHDVFPDPQRYTLLKPRDQAVTSGKGDQVQPLSPLHHLVRHHSQQQTQLPFPAFPAGFPLPPMPFMRAPMFMPNHFRPYPQQLPTINQQVQSSQEAPKSEPTKQSTRPKISHNIDDLLARSPPKTKKPISTTIEQPKPVIIQPLQDVRPKEYHSSSPHSPHPAFQGSNHHESPLHHLAAMDRLYALSPRNLPQYPNHLTQSPKTGSFAPDSHPASPRSTKPRGASRSLEEDFKKQYQETMMQEALRQRQQKLAEDYRQLLKLQSAKLALEKEDLKEEQAKERRAYVPDINRTQCYSKVEAGYITEFARETVFPHRHGEDDSKDHTTSLADRLSPTTLDSVPVDFSKAAQNKAGPPRFQCDGCKKSYSTLNGLSKHKEFHCVSHVKKEFSCKHCAKTYTSLGALKMHIRTHTLPCKCQLCGKAFSRPWLLQGHIRTHTGEKPFSCAHCQRSFADRSNLRAHLQTHTDVKRYSCDHCTKTFSRMSLLTKHRENGCGSAIIHS